MGMIYLYTGTGTGKTTNALGLALRAIGHNQKVIIIQFLKGRKDIGEYKVKDRLAPNYEIHQFGTREFVDPKNLKDIDYKLAKKGLEFVKKAMKRKPNLLVLDEINIALHFKLLNVDEVIDLLKNLPKRTNVVLTGRYAPKKLMEVADFVNEIKDIKHPKKIPMTKGIRY